jgi:hypothetical protein
MRFPMRFVSCFIYLNWFTKGPLSIWCVLDLEELSVTKSCVLRRTYFTSFSSNVVVPIQTHIECCSSQNNLKNEPVIKLTVYLFPGLLVCIRRRLIECFRSKAISKFILSNPQIRIHPLSSSSFCACSSSLSCVINTKSKSLSC